MEAATTIIGIIAISALAWLAYQYAPFIQGMLDKNFSEDGNEECEDKSLQPLYKVFYKFSHKSSDEWIRWILSEDKDSKNAAFEKLRSYLENPPEQLGIATKEVIKAITVFKRHDSFDILNNLFAVIRPKLGQLKSIDLFFEDLCLALIKLDAPKAIKSLKNELQLLDSSQTDGISYEEFKIHIIKSLISLESFNQDLSDYFVNIIMNRSYSARLRKEAVKLLCRKSIETHEYIYTQVLKNQVQSTAQVISKDYQDVLEELFNNSKVFINNDNNIIWGLLIQNCYKEATQELFTKLLIDTITNTNEQLSERQLQEILEVEPPIKDPLRSALIERNSLSETEISLFKTKIKEEDLSFNEGTIVLERSKKTKTISPELLKEYHLLDETIVKEGDQTNKSERKSSHTIKLLTGTGEKEKIYLLRGLAANTNRTFVYIDMQLMINCSIELNKLISTISNSKPSIVYVDKTFEILNRDLQEDEETGLKLFLKTIKELAILPTVSFWGGFGVDANDIPTYKGLSGLMTSGIRGTYKPLANINKPDFEARSRIFKVMLSKVNSSKIDSEFRMEDILNPSEGMSTLEYSMYLAHFFETSLMISGKISRPKNVSIFDQGVNPNPINLEAEIAAVVSSEPLPKELASINPMLESNT